MEDEEEEEDGKHTVAGSPANQDTDEGMWAWLEGRQRRAGGFYCPSLTRLGEAASPKGKLL